MKSYEEIMEILEAFDLTGSFRAAGELAGCSHHTVEAYVARRDAGLLPSRGEPAERVKLIAPFLPKLEQWVERSQGKIRGDVVFDKLESLGLSLYRAHGAVQVVSGDRPPEPGFRSLILDPTRQVQDEQRL